MKTKNNPYHSKWLGKRLGKVHVKNLLRVKTDGEAAQKNYPGWCGARGAAIIKIGIRE